jgi:hypothetical protein
MKKMKNPNKNINAKTNEVLTVDLKEGRRELSQSSVKEHVILTIIIVAPMIVPTIAK